ncbi:uncharacterized protein [Watersipora subatra]|uniref:uncharacterized protein n=1 Tax=Watersipora subatra TaxID=2589382 RepID=UPI00355B42E1
MTAFGSTMNLFNCLFMVAIITGILHKPAESRRTKSRNQARERSEPKGTKIDSMICPDCERLFCYVKKASKLMCNGGGVTTDICGCCPVCAKQVGDPCGGEWNYLGKCDVGLYCKAPHSSASPSTGEEIKTEVPMGGIPEGTCVKSPDIQKDDSVLKPPAQQNQQQCQPKCSPEFCLANPRSICSAVDVVDMKRDCHGSCQHTSCQACSWVNPDPECGACAPDDFNCIKRFAKCIKRSYCTRSKFPCKDVEEREHVGKFQCMVPKCLDQS